MNDDIVEETAKTGFSLPVPNVLSYVDEQGYDSVVVLARKNGLLDIYASYDTLSTLKDLEQAQKNIKAGEYDAA